MTNQNRKCCDISGQEVLRRLKSGNVVTFMERKYDISRHEVLWQFMTGSVVTVQTGGVVTFQERSVTFLGARVVIV